MPRRLIGQTTMHFFGDGGARTARRIIIFLIVLPTLVLFCLLGGSGKNPDAAEKAELAWTDGTEKGTSGSESGAAPWDEATGAEDKFEIARTDGTQTETAASKSDADSLDNVVPAAAATTPVAEENLSEDELHLINKIDDWLDTIYARPRDPRALAQMIAEDSKIVWRLQSFLLDNRPRQQKPPKLRHQDHQGDWFGLRLDAIHVLGGLAKQGMTTRSVQVSAQDALEEIAMQGLSEDGHPIAHQILNNVWFALREFGFVAPLRAKAFFEKTAHQGWDPLMGAALDQGLREAGHEGKYYKLLSGDK